MKKAIKIFAVLTLFIGWGLQSRSLVAQPATIITADEIRSLSDKNTDTLYVVNMWATWCKPCIKEMPYFKEAQSELKDNPIRFFFVSLDRNTKQLQNYLDKTGYDKDMYLLKDSNPNDFIPTISKDWQGAIPTTLFIRPNQNIYSVYEQEFTKDALLTTIKKYIP